MLNCSLYPSLHTLLPLCIHRSTLCSLFVSTAPSILCSLFAEEWARPIFGLTSDFKSLSRDEREQRDYAHLTPSVRRRLRWGLSAEMWSHLTCNFVVLLWKLYVYVMSLPLQFWRGRSKENWNGNRWVSVHESVQCVCVCAGLCMWHLVPSCSALKPGDQGWIGRARVPMPSNKDYVVRPKWNVEAESKKVCCNVRIAYSMCVSTAATICQTPG